MNRRVSSPAEVRGAPMDGLAQAIARFAQSDGDYATAIPGLSLHRRKGPTEPLHCIFRLGLGVVAQGHKQALVGKEVVNYGPGQSMLTSIDLPVISHVTRASAETPMLGLMLTLDSRDIVKTAAEMQLQASSRLPSFAPVTVETLDDALLGAMVRLIGLLDQPDLAPHLAPLLKQEILVRLLAGAHRVQLLHLAANGSLSQHIARAVTWLRQNYSAHFQVDELAGHAHMSPSTFRQHFRSITGTSPLQYQKQLRLQEARQLMLSLGIDAGSAAVQVGYESASQFSREYSRLFGAPPQQDVRRLRLA
ncbi:AraC family transcriptional regulator [Paraburkholderia sp. BCC1886]|uniref:AraC family transcriptional regulator n=1 Tax=Paraburkholderia sp. BCC1886 TaxID=2562670 RepID=UPI0011845556|nr:AraC family transcriptional regulator [Paraburkholderia sp. BCC1886]